MPPCLLSDLGLMETVNSSAHLADDPTAFDDATREGAKI